MFDCSDPTEIREIDTVVNNHGVKYSRFASGKGLYYVMHDMAIPPHSKQEKEERKADFCKLVDSLLPSCPEDKPGIKQTLLSLRDYVCKACDSTKPPGQPSGLNVVYHTDYFFSNEQKTVSEFIISYFQ